MAAAVSLAAPRMSTDEAAPESEHTIDDLAALTRVPSRTIRFYQSVGALPGPKIRGRVAFYGGSHIERLKLIASLQDRGLRMRAIRDLLAQVDKGELALSEWLGLEEKLQTPWANDRPRVVTESELLAILGTRRPGRIADLVRLDLVERRGDRFLVHSPALLAIGLRLEAAGIELETAAAATSIMRRHLHRVATELVDHFVKRAGKGFGGEGSAESLEAAYEAIRPTGLEAVQIVFAQEMERSLRALLESGAATTALAKKKKKK
jgi:DNA-binding transcriptional MerR regulator